MASVEVWWCSLDDFAESGPMLDAILSDDERRRRDAFVFDTDRQMYALSHAMLRLLLVPYTGQAPREIEILTDENGRPYLASTGVDFNLSHTKGWAAVAISREARVGIDIEAMNRNVDSLLANSMILTERERHDCLSQPWAQQGRRFLSFWVLKESLLKGMGEGLSRRPDELEFVLADPPRITKGLQPGQEWNSLIWEEDGLFLIGLAVSAPLIDLSCHRFSFDSKIDRDERRL
jgi:4'-phosphopantetheinyl transferase